jgi:uncharacterized repeat protein (TIGR01451 family)
MVNVSSSTADLNANNTSSATVIVTPNPDAPLLKIVRNGTTAVLSWSTNAVGYTLQSRTNFSSASVWVSITNGLRQSGGLFFITNPVTAGTSFYRLSKTAADLMIQQIASPSLTEVTSNATFTITVSNSGPSTATNVVVTENVPAGLSIISIQSPAGTFCNQSNGVITCNLGNLANAMSAELILVVRANLDGTFVSTAGVTSTTPDFHTNNTSIATLIVAPNPNAPLLKITRLGTKVVLSWSTNAAGFTLQSTTDFSSLWGPISVQGQSGGQYFVTNSATGTSFYRLIK